MSVTTVDFVEVNQQHIQRHTPNHVVLDAWILGFGGFNMTVGKRHLIMKAGTDNDLTLLGANKI